MNKTASTKRVVFMLSFLISMLPSLAIAETAAEGEDSSLTAPTSGTTTPTATATTSPTPATSTSRESTTLLLNVVNENNNRYLGDVKISFQRYPQDSKYSPVLVHNPVKVPEPPPPGGYEIKDIKTRQYELIAERKGYKIYNEVVNIESDKTYAELTIKMTPLVGTPEVNEGDLDEYKDSLNSYLASRYGGTSLGQFSLSTSSPYNTANNTGTISSPYLTYPDYGTTSGTLGGYQATQQTSSGQTQYGGQYSGNILHSDQRYTIPLVTKVTSSSNSSGLLIKMVIADNNTQAVDDSEGLFTQSGGTFTSCLRPNTNYQIIVGPALNRSQFSGQTTVRYLTTPSTGTGVGISISYYGMNSIQINAEELSQSSLQSIGNIQCPNSNYSTSGMTGPSTFGDNLIQFEDLSENYKIDRMPGSGLYYLINKNNSSDYRKLYFVDRGDGKGGLVFITAEQTTYNKEPSSNAQWYLTGYSRTDNDDIKFKPDSFAKSPISPKEYANIVDKSVSQMFEEEEKKEDDKKTDGDTKKTEDKKDGSGTST